MLSILFIIDNVAKKITYQKTILKQLVITSTYRYVQTAEQTHLRNAFSLLKLVSELVASGRDSECCVKRRFVNCIYIYIYKDCSVTLSILRLNVFVSITFHMLAGYINDDIRFNKLSMLQASSLVLLC